MDVLIFTEGNIHAVKYTLDYKARESNILEALIRTSTVALLFHSHMEHYSSLAVAKGGRSIERLVRWVVKRRRWRGSPRTRRRAGRGDF